MRALVICVGNPYRSDDAAGPAVAGLLRRSAPAGLEVAESDGEPAALLTLWEGADTVYVVDAVTSGSAPGTVHRADLDDMLVAARTARGSTHGLGVAEAIDLGRALDRMPPRMVLIGIEGERFAAGTAMTPAVEAAVPEVARMIREEVHRCA